MTPRKQFRLLYLFECLPARPIQLRLVNNRDSLVKLTKLVINGDENHPRPLLTMTGLLAWLPENLHFQPLAERYVFYYNVCTYTSTSMGHISYSVDRNPPPKSKNKFAKFVDTKQHRPKKLKAKGAR